MDQPVDRRGFLRMVGRTVAGVGLGAGLGGLLAACEKEEVVTHTTATVTQGETTATVTQGETTATTAAPSTSTTTVAVKPESGRPIRLGVVTARTGPLALFGRADDWWIKLGSEAVREGVVCGDGKVRTVAFSVEDCGSNPQLAARLASGLIAEERVDLIMCSGDSDIVNAVADRAEEGGCPCLADFVTWQTFVGGRGGAFDKPFKWTYAHAVGMEDLAANYLAMWSQVTTNKVVGLALPDDAEGGLWADEVSGLPALAAEVGYQCLMSGPHTPGSVDFGGQIEEFKKGGCEICFCRMTTKEFLSFWSQATREGYQPKVVTVSGGLLFPHALEALGPKGLNMTAECLWQPSWPYRDSLRGMSAQQLAEDYQLKTGEQWTAAIALYAKFEWAVEVFRKTRSIIDKEQIIARVRTAKLDTCRGPLDFMTPAVPADVGITRRPTYNVYKAPVGGAQWFSGSAFSFEPRLVSRVYNAELPVTGTTQPMVYL